MDFIILLLFVSFASCTAITKGTETETQCVLIQKKEIIQIHFEAPSFLKNANKTYCQVNRGVFRHKGLTAVNIDRPEINKGMLKCGNTDIYIEPECICSFYNVFEATLYHGYSSCPAGAESDIVTNLKCPDCKKYSLKNNGPCINGGKLTCRGEEVAPKITCQCPPNYEGAFCENKIENVTWICNRMSPSSPSDLDNCNVTWKECVTYSRNELYAYKCETNTLQDSQGLPLCLDTENTTDIRSSETNQKGNTGRNFDRRHAIFYLYLVLVVLAFAGFCMLQILFNERELTENASMPTVRIDH